MSHEPYEQWIYDDEDLTQEQEQAMQAHLNGCSDCQQIDQTWKDVRKQMRSLPMASPQAGFSQRWHASLAERRQIQEKIQIRRFLIILFSSSAAILVLLAGMILISSTPIDWIAAGIKSLFTVLFAATTTTQEVLSWLSVLPASIPLIVWIVGTSSLAILSVTWMYFMWRISKKGETIL